MPDAIARRVLHDVEPLDADESVGDAVRKLVEAQLPGLPAVEADGRYAGVFGAHEFLAAFFPAYLEDLRGFAVISRTVDEAIERRLDCVDEPIRAYLNTDHVVVDGDYSDTQLAELFLHHPIDLIPIQSNGRVHALVMLDEFFHALGTRLVSAGPAGAGG